MTHMASSNLQSDRAIRVSTKVGRLVTAASLAIALTLGYGILQGTSIRVERVSVGCRGLPRAAWGLTILQISDLHAGSSLKLAKRTAELLGSLSARLMVITGDMAVQGGSPENSTAAARLLTGSAKRDMPVYAVAGESDSPEIMAGLETAGVKVIDNKAVPIVSGLWLVGWTPLGEASIALNDILQTLPTGSEFILASHSPEVMLQEGSARAKLVLTGHTHGGQIRLPFVRPTMLLTRLGPAYFAGLYKYGDSYLYISRGLGTARVPLRLYSPPEITLFTLWARQ